MRHLTETNRIACCLPTCSGVYNVDTSQISVSGISSGAAMATQMHVAYSSIIMGAGMFAGSKSFCSAIDEATGRESRPCFCLQITIIDVLPIQK